MPPDSRFCNGKRLSTFRVRWCQWGFGDLVILRQAQDKSGDWVIGLGNWIGELDLSNWIGLLKKGKCNLTGDQIWGDDSTNLRSFCGLCGNPREKFLLGDLATT